MSEICRDFNHILSSIPESELAVLKPHLELSNLLLGDMLYETGREIHYAYFPTTAIVSLTYLTEEGSSTEIAGVGYEGMVGCTLFMGSDTTNNSAVVQTAGHAFRLSAKILQQEFNRGGQFQKMLLRYTQVLITQTGQTAVCNRQHSVEQQLCRWLLQILDRLPAQELVMTQELVAGMLGVRREGITAAAGKLQKDGIISYRRGHISILNRSRLEKRTCECYQVVKDEMDRLLFD